MSYDIVQYVFDHSSASASRDIHVHTDKIVRRTDGESQELRVECRWAVLVPGNLRLICRGSDHRPGSWACHGVDSVTKALDER